MIRWLAGFLVLVAAAPVAAQEFAPRDECANIEGADAFRMALATAVANRDADMLLSITWPEVMLDFGGGSGRETLRLRLDQPSYNLWQELERLLLLGCARTTGDILIMPWFFGQDLGRDDPFTSFLVIGADVPLHVQPELESEVIGRLTWTQVTLIGDWAPQDEFLHVRTGSGVEGYMRQDHLRSEIDYRLIAAPGEKGYRITALIAGD